MPARPHLGGDGAGACRPLLLIAVTSLKDQSGIGFAQAGPWTNMPPCWGGSAIASCSRSVLIFAAVTLVTVA
jgi:hypothetical protein